MAKVADIEVFGLNQMLRDLRRLPKEAQDELRKESKDIASQLMVPYWKEAAENAGPWGGAIASTVRAKRDRIPSVSIGSNRRAFSGGASPTAVRFPSHAGPSGRAAASGTLPAAFYGQATGWMQQMGGYKGEALKKWLSAIDRIKRKFERG
jgi:hypothetical protein